MQSSEKNWSRGQPDQYGYELKCLSTWGNSGYEPSAANGRPIELKTLMWKQIVFAKSSTILGFQNLFISEYE